MIRFAKDGQITMQTIGPAKHGTYQLDSQGYLKVVMDNGERFQASLMIGNNALTLTDPDGTTSQFKRTQ
jgi:hypothetical protein